MKKDELKNELVILKHVNKGFLDKKFKLKKILDCVKAVHSRQNNAELSGISIDKSNDIHEETVISICKEHKIDVSLTSL